MTYPTLRKIGRSVIHSEEGQYNSRKEWVPDVMAQRSGLYWHVKYRNSAQWCGPYSNEQDCRAAIAKATGGAP